MNDRPDYSKGWPGVAVLCVVPGAGCLGAAFFQAKGATADALFLQDQSNQWLGVSQHLSRLRSLCERPRPAANEYAVKQMQDVVAGLAESLKAPEPAAVSEVNAAGKVLIDRTKALLARRPNSQNADERKAQFGDLALRAELLEARAQEEQKKIVEEQESLLGTEALANELPLLAGGLVLLLAAVSVFSYVIISRARDEWRTSQELRQRLAKISKERDKIDEVLQAEFQKERSEFQEQYVKASTILAGVENTPIILWAVDLAGTYTVRGGHAHTDAGLPQGHGVGRSHAEVEEARPGTDESLSRALAGETFSAEFCQGDHWYNTRYRPLTGADGAIVGACGVTADVSARKAAEVKALQEEGVRQATRLKTEFMANMSHELRTPMNGIVGMVGLLGSTSLSDEQQGMLDIIQSSTDNLLRTVNDIIDLSKLETGKLKLAETEFVPHELLNDILQQFSRTAAAKGLELIGDLDLGTRATVQGDPDRLRQMISNLVDNAVKYTAKGHVLLQVRSDENAKEGIRFSITISDTGAGIEKSRIEELLKPYDSQGGTATRKVGDVGFGLSISQKLVELLGGTLTLASDVGRGTSADLVFCLPVKEYARAPEAPFKDRRFLVVDDSEVTRGILAVKLAGGGGNVDVAANANDAFTLAQARLDSQAPYDLILVDRFMPGIDGAQFAAMMRSQNGLSRIPLVLISPPAEPLEADKRKNFAAELEKPVDDRVLMDTVERTLAIARREEPAPPPPKPQAPSTAEDAAPLKILVADDNAVNVAVCRKMLEKLGHQVDVAGNGQEALEAVAKGGYDAVFMDCQMPVIDGYEATRTLRASPESWSHVWIVAVTANASTADRRNCFAVGMNDFLTKPLKLPAVQEALAKRRRELATRPA